LPPSNCTPTLSTANGITRSRLAHNATLIFLQSLRGRTVAHWDIVLGHIRRADPAKIKDRFPEPHTTLFRAIQVSFESLREDDTVSARRYLSLAVMLENMAVAPAVRRTLWNVPEDEALETADRFIGLSLAQPDASGRNSPARHAIGLRARAIPEPGDAELGPRRSAAKSLDSMFVWGRPPLEKPPR